MTYYDEEIKKIFDDPSKTVKEKRERYFFNIFLLNYYF